MRARHIEKVDGFSAHGDQADLLAWCDGFERSPRRTFIVHGEPDARATLAERLGERDWKVAQPAHGEAVVLQPTGASRDALGTAPSA